MTRSDELVRRLGAKRLKLEAELEAVRRDLADACRTALAEGTMRQIDAVKATGYTREMIRRMVTPVAPKRKAKT